MILCYFETLYEKYINEEIFHKDISSYAELHYLLVFVEFLIGKKNGDRVKTFFRNKLHHVRTFYHMISIPHDSTRTNHKCMFVSCILYLFLLDIFTFSGKGMSAADHRAT